MTLKRFRSLFGEFRLFAFKGNVIDLAVGIVIGTAFNTVVKSAVENIIMPAVSYLSAETEGYTAWTVGRLQVGKFAGELVNFLVVAAIIFIVVAKVIKPLMAAATEPAPAPAAPTTKQCPMCCSAIPLQAKRCPQCTSDLADQTSG